MKKSYFPDCWKVSSVISAFKNVGKGLQLKTTAISLLSVVSKVFEKLNDRTVDHLEKCGPFF